MTSDAEGAQRSFAFGPFVLVPERQLLLQGETPVRIGGRALGILTALVEKSGEILGKRELMARVWPDVVVDEGNLKVNMAALRRALGDDTGAARYIATVIGRGYRFVAPVQASAAPSPEPVATGMHRHNLPTGITRVFGRAEAIEAIGGEVERSRIVSIVGAGGIGKTTVAIAVAERAIGHFEHGVWLVDLAPLKDPGLVPNAIASTIGVVMHRPSTLAAVCDFLRERKMLLILDSCEHVIDAVAASANQILTAAADVKILATSREPLMVNGERVRRLPGLATPPSSSPLSASESLEFPAIQLFVDRATNRLESFTFGDSDAPAVAEICRKLDGLALAIELAATRIDAFGVDGLLEQLDDRLRVLSGRRAGPERHRTLAATLDWSYGLLSADEATLLRSVSAFAGVFDIDGATAVSGLARAEVTEALVQLAAKSFLATNLDSNGIAYRLLETTRADCLERMQTLGENQAVRQRHAEHVCGVLELATSQWAKRPASEWSADYGRFLDDLRDAIAWAAKDPANRSLRIRLTLAGILLWNQFSLTEECRAHVSQAVEQLEPAELSGTAFEMKLKLWLGGSSMVTRGFAPQALDVMKRALEIAIRTNDLDYRLRCLSGIGLFEIWTGDHEAGLHTMETFISVAAASDPSAMPEGEVHAAIAMLFLGRLPDARHRLETLRLRDLRYFNRSYEVRYLADTLALLESVLSHVQWVNGLPDTAVRSTDAAIERTRSNFHHLSLNNALSYACAVHYWRGDHATCGRLVAMLDEHVARHGIVARRPVAMFYRAALACACDTPSAEDVDDLQRAIEAFHDINHLARMPYYLAVVAEAHARRGNFGEAETWVRSALALADVQKERWCLPEILRIQASIATARNEPGQAESLLLESMSIAQETGALSWRLRSANDLARIWCAGSRSKDAQDLLRPIFDAFSEGFDTPDLRTAADLLASGTPAA